MSDLRSIYAPNSQIPPYPFLDYSSVTSEPKVNVNKCPNEHESEERSIENLGDEEDKLNLTETETDNLSELISKQLQLKDTSASFLAEFSDGYSFRNMFEYLRITNIKGNFRFSRDLICYEQADASMTIVNQIEISTCELTCYQFNSQTDEIVIGINISDMRNITKTIGKKDSVRIYKQADDPILYIQIITQSTRGSMGHNVSVIRPITDVEITMYEMPEYRVSEKYPNCTIPMTEFTRTCTSMSTFRCSYVTIIGLPKGAIFKTLTEGTISGKYQEFGICDGYTTTPSPQSYGQADIDFAATMRLSLPTGPPPKLVVKSENKPVAIIKIKMAIIKALSKLNNLSTSGTIKMYMESDNPLKLVCRIGTYGILRIFIRTDDAC